MFSPARAREYTHTQTGAHPKQKKGSFARAHEDTHVHTCLLLVACMHSYFRLCLLIGLCFLLCLPLFAFSISCARTSLLGAGHLLDRCLANAGTECRMCTCIMSCTLLLACANTPSAIPHLLCACILLLDCLVADCFACWLD